MAFGSDFVWGAATASYQIEGAAREDGRGECIWTRFSHNPGNVDKGDTGDVACDHYHRYPQDIELMKALGIDAYRFSVSWPRVLPQGTGTPNQRGLQFYDKLVDALLEAGITPYLTLYHWDLPQALQDKGGWANEDSVHWFRDYAAMMSDKLGDRVKHWTTFNEPWVVAFVGNEEGRHAPGIKDIVTAYRVAHHLLLAHAQAVPVIRENVSDSQVGIVLNLTPVHPNTNTEPDVQAALRLDAYINRWFLDALFKGEYPYDLVAWQGERLRGIDRLDAVSTAKIPLDYVGVNYYTRNVVAHDDTGGVLQLRHVKQSGATYTEMNWEVYPQGLTEILTRLQADYAPAALYITENGSAWDDDMVSVTPEEDTETGIGPVIEDARRVDYLQRHLAAVDSAIEQGAPVKGYFAWSLMDNFEWGYGYSKRFGLIHVDYETLQRTWKRSALTYRDFIKAQ